MKALMIVIKFIVNHPISSKSKIRSVLRFFWWQIRCKIISKPYVHQFTPNSKLILKQGMTGATGNLYCGLHDYSEMLFLIHYLRPNDVFVDIGANIGSYTVLASAEIGAKTYSFEPVPNTFLQLKENVVINNIEALVSLHPIGLASSNGKLSFSIGSDSAMNHVLIHAETNTDNVSVEVQMLDSVLNGVQPNLMKIDVEGFEFEVLNGSNETLKSQTLNAIIIELNSSGLNYGVKDQDIHEYLKSFGFNSYKYNPMNRELKSVDYAESNNILYIKDVELVQQRLKSARKIKILNVEI